jgi:hypothetical protein
LPHPTFVAIYGEGPVLTPDLYLELPSRADVLTKMGQVIITSISQAGIFLALMFQPILITTLLVPFLSLALMF